MHESSLMNMRKFAEKYLNEGISYRILDLGSQEVAEDPNGSYRRIFEKEGWLYEGADLVRGNNVDIVLEHPYRWKNIKSKTYDCVVCGQMLEHDEFFWLTMLEIQRILKPNGLCCIIAPSGGSEHRYPVDCYRYYPDGLRAVANYAGMEVLEVYAQWNEKIFEGMDSEWRDCVLICKRPKLGIRREWKRAIKSSLIHLGSANVNSIQYGNVYSLKSTWATPKPNLFSSLYYDTGKGFNEGEVERKRVISGEVFKQKYVLTGDCIALRFDPIEGYRCIIKDFCVKMQNQMRIQNQWENNGMQVGEDMFLFLDTTDPQIFITGIGGGYAWVEISGCIYYID